MALLQSPSLAISITDKPESGTFETAAALVGWALNLLISIPASAITILSHLAIEQVFTAWWGDAKLSNKWDSCSPDSH